MGKEEMTIPLSSEVVKPVSSDIKIEGQMSLSQRLELALGENPDKYNEDSIVRVRQMVEYEEKNPKNPKPYIAFQTIEDWKLYYNLHPEWQEKSSEEMREKKGIKGYAFYAAFTKWCKKSSQGNTDERRRLIQEVFSSKHRDWSAFRNLDDWKDEFLKHPEWQEKSANQIRSEKETGRMAFYQAFHIWCKRASQGNENERKRLIREIFLQKQHDWSAYTTIDDWKAEFLRHPEWQEKSIREMQKNRELNGNAYYKAFISWSKKASNGNEEERKSLLREIFPDRTKKAQEGISSREADQVLEGILEEENG